MGLLFVLIVWGFLFCIISLPLGLVGNIIANFYSNHKKRGSKENSLVLCSHSTSIQFRRPILRRRYCL